MTSERVYVGEGAGMGGGFGSWGFIIFFLIIIWAFLGNGLGGRGGCDRVSTCEAEKQEIIDSYNTQLGVINQGNLTRQTVEAGNNVLATKIDFYAYENLKDQLAQERTKNVVLENRIFANEQYNALTAQNTALMTRLDRIECETPKRPPYFAQGYVPDGYRVPPNGCGYNC